MQATRILPDLQCSLLCEEVRQEVNGNLFLIGVMHFLRVPQAARHRRPHLHLQPLDGRHRPVHRKRAAYRAGPDHGREQGRIEVRAARPGDERHDRDVFRQREI